MQQVNLFESPRRKKNKTLSAIIYEPKGAANEYGELAVNLYSGCHHGCVYCYVPAVLRMSKTAFHSKIGIKKDALARLEKNCTKYAGINKTVFLSFTTDPYQPMEDSEHITREAIRTLNSHDIAVNILTKGGMRAARDFELLRLHPRNKFGVTLTTDNDETSKILEPHAALPQERIESLRSAKEQGINTWVSFEPVYEPDAVYRMIDVTHSFVDEYKVGKLNHNAAAKCMNWSGFHTDVIVKLQEHGCKYFIKDDLKKAAGITA